MTSTPGATIRIEGISSQLPDADYIQIQSHDTALLLSNGKLRMALDIGKLGAWECDLETGEISATASFKTSLGLAPEAALTRSAFKAMVHPSDAERLEQAITFSLKTKTDFQIEHRVIRADGRIGRVLSRGSAVYDEHDKPVRLMGIIQDVTERERIKEETTLAQRRQEFLSKLNEQIGGLDDPFAIMEISAKSLAQFLKVDSSGYGEVFEDKDLVIVEREWSKGLFSNEGRVEKISDLSPQVIDPLRQGHPLFTEDALNDPWVRNDPEKVAFYTSVNVRTILTAPLLKNGGLVAVYYVSSAQPRPWPSEDIALVQDAADRTWMAIEKGRANIRLRETNERLRMITESLPAIIWSVDPDLRLTYLNESWNTLMDSSPSLASYEDWQELVHPHDLVELLNGENIHRKNQSIYTAEIRYRSADGAYRWHLLRAAPNIDADGTFKGWHGTSIDIHEYKLAKEEAERNSSLRQAG